MELKVNAVAIPDPITFNYEELKAELLQKVSVYETMVYTDDQIKVAKEDRANLNRLKKALNDERLKQEREYMQPFNQFKAQIQEIISIIDKPVAVIDKQVKEFEEKRKAEKFMEIQDYFFSLPKVEGFEDLLLSQIYEDKWLNTSVSMKSIQEAIGQKIGKIMDDLDVVRSMPSYAFEAEQEYKRSLDLTSAVREAHRLQDIANKKAAWEAELAKKPEPVNYGSSKSETPVKEPDAEPCRQWIGFQAFLSVDEAKALGTWLKAMEIKYKKI